MDYSYLFRRQHPEYQRNRQCWERCQQAYSGGADYIARALIQHVSEIDLEYAERLNRAYYFNYPRKIARIITQYILASDPVRLNADAELVEDFSRNGLRVNEIMRQFSTMLNVYGAAWMLVEMPRFSGSVDPLRRRSENIRPYVVTLSPLAVVDWAEGTDGKLDWALIEENFFDNSNVYAPPRTARRRRLWTRNSWQLFEEENSVVKLVDEGTHDLGCLPLIHVVEADGYGMHCGHWFEDAVRISDAILNNESEAQMNVIKQMFGLLVISENFARGSRPARISGNSGESKFSHVLARSAAVWESSEESGITRYISPNGVPANAIRNENSQLKNELFDVVGLTITRETREIQSAESKAWDHQQLCQFLLNRVDMLEQTELAAWQLMNKYDPAVTIPHLAYNRDFAIVDLRETVAGLLELRNIEAGNEYQKEIARTAAGLLNRFQKTDPQVQQIIYNEIEKLPNIETEKGAEQ